MLPQLQLPTSQEQQQALLQLTTSQQQEAEDRRLLAGILCKEAEEAFHKA